jgi:hypothetical protein
MRTTKKVRELLEVAAEASGRSLVQEVERRLETSFQTDALFNLLVGQDLARPVMLYLGMLAQYGVGWREAVAEVSEGIALIAHGVAADGLSKETARKFLLNAARYHGTPAGTALTLAYTILETAGLAPDHNALNLETMK